MDISGKWLFSEDFETGVNSGFAFLDQEDDRITGRLELTEQLHDETPIHVVQEIEGLVMGGKIIFKGNEFKLMNGTEDCEYALDSWEGILNSEGKIVGSSIDEQGICGVFIMEKSIE